jgi:hypothetical protein
MGNLVNPYLYPVVATDIFADAFDDSSFDTSKWVRRHSDANVTLTETSHLLWTMAGGSVAVNDAIDSIATFDFTNRTMDCYIDTNTTLMQGFFFIAGIITNPTGDNNNRASIVLDPNGAGSLSPAAVGQTRISNVNTTTGNSPGGAIFYYRMVHDSGADTLKYYYSAAGVTYTLLGTFNSFAANFGSITAVKAFIWMTGGGAGTSRNCFIKDFRIY